MKNPGEKKRNPFRSLKDSEEKNKDDSKRGKLIPGRLSVAYVTKGLASRSHPIMMTMRESLTVSRIKIKGEKAKGCDIKDTKYWWHMTRSQKMSSCKRWGLRGCRVGGERSRRPSTLASNLIADGASWRWKQLGRLDGRKQDDDGRSVSNN